MSDLGAKGELLGTQTAKQQTEQSSHAEESPKKEEDKKVSKKNFSFDQQFYCDALNDSNVNSIVDGSDTDTIVLVGFVGYGKTTFISTLYYRLINSISYNGHILYDSDTYAGLERRFAIRTIKTDIDAETKRTIKGEDHILALSLMDENSGVRRKIVVSDRSGEDYKAYTGNAKDMLDDGLLKVADHMVFFVDVQEMMNATQSVKYDYGLLLTGLEEQHLIPDNCRLSLVFNKYDLINNGNKSKFEQKAINVQQLFIEKLPSRNITTYYIDSTGANDNFIAVDRLTKDLLASSSHCDRRRYENIDWVGKELRSLKNE